MSRIKRYYTIDEITSNLYTSGKELMKTDGAEYIGLYHRYNTGEIYSQATWNPSLSVQLITYVDKKQQNNGNSTYKTLRPNVNVSFFAPLTAPPAITAENIKTGLIQRYFIKRYDQSLILEISQETYKEWQNNIVDKNLFTAASIKWKIKGEQNDRVTDFNINVEGVISFNTRQIKKAEKLLPGLSLYLNNPLQFYISSAFTNSIDINGLD